MYAPCAGPILAGVITVSAAQNFTVGRLAVALAYSIGSAIVLYLLMLGGRRITDRLGALRCRVQVVMGAVMIAVAVVMIANLDVRFESAIAGHLPSALVDPTSRIEQSSSVSGDLAALHGGGPVSHETGTSQAAAGQRLPVYFQAPDFTGTQDWFNTPGDQPLSLDQLRGQVVLVDFWTYTCINCIRTLPYIEAWYQKYHQDGFTVVGVHTPEFPFEKEASNVQQAIGDFGLTYPVVQDNNAATWNAYNNQYWPADYLIDAKGRVRLVHFGEGSYTETEDAIRSLLAEAGHENLGRHAKAHAEHPDAPCDAGELPRRGPRRALRQRADPPGDPAVRHRLAVLALLRPARLRRAVEDRAGVGDGGRGGEPGAQLQRQAGLPGPRLSRRAAQDAGAPRRQADPELARRPRRARWRSDDLQPAPLPARRPPAPGVSRADAAAGERHLGLRVHVRLAPTDI